MGTKSPAVARGFVTFCGKTYFSCTLAIISYIIMLAAAEAIAKGTLDDTETPQTGFAPDGEYLLADDDASAQAGAEGATEGDEQ